MLMALEFFFYILYPFGIFITFTARYDMPLIILLAISELISQFTYQMYQGQISK